MVRSASFWPSVGLGLSLILCAVVPSHAAPRLHPAATLFDNDDRMDLNNLDMAITNRGSIAFDLTTVAPGLIYPKGTTKSLVYAAGLWIGAKVNGNTLVSIGEYQQEYVPGPMQNGGPLPDMFQFQNYTIDRQGTGHSDYLLYAVPQGAPLDSLGNPYLLGDRLIWSVFNDADTLYHHAAAGSQAPLGVEVQQSVFAFNRSGPLGDVVFVKWRLANKGGLTLDSMYVSLWADPDLGDFSDDLVGCDSTMGLGYAYNATNADAVYGSAPPAVGFHLLKGATANGTDLGMTSFLHFINGTDPQTALQSYHYMQGRHADGAALHVCDDPGLAVTAYDVPGDPHAPASCPSNWLDTNEDDRRLFLSSGPFTMMPGDTQVVILAIEVGHSTDRLASIDDLKNTALVVRTIYGAGFIEPSTAVESYLVDSRAEPGAIHLGWYVPGSPGTPITVERRTDATAWASMAETSLPTGGVLRFDDTAVAPGERYGYRLVVWSGAAPDHTAETWIQAAAEDAPTTLRLLPGRPNPSSATFQIRHYVPRRGSFRLSVLDVQGRVIRVLANRELTPGWYEATWDGRDLSGRDAASGIYFVRIEGMGAAETRKVVLSR